MAFPVEKSVLAPLISLFFFVRFFFLKRTKGSALPARPVTSSGKSESVNTTLTQRQIDQAPKNLSTLKELSRSNEKLAEVLLLRRVLFDLVKQFTYPSNRLLHLNYG